MILTVTLNPAVDQTIRVPSLKVGQVLRVSESHLDPAGKGINVSRMVDRLDWPTIAFGFLAGEIGLLAERALSDEGVQSHFIRVPGQTRLNVTVFDEASGRGTSFYDRGPSVDAERLARLRRDINPWLGTCKVLVLAGSLPPGVPSNTYAEYVRLANSLGIRTMVDSHDDPLRLAVAAHPYLIKPDVAEAEKLLGRPLPDQQAMVAATIELAARDVEVVVISMGARGAVCARAGEVWLAVPPPVERQSTVGSGDAMVAGLAIAAARGEDIVEGLRLGTAAGAATAATPGTALGTPEEIARLLPLVRLERLLT